ncbi:hypothetical protein D3C80_1741130 [compost metagenome]
MVDALQCGVIQSLRRTVEYQAATGQADDAVAECTCQVNLVQIAHHRDAKCAGCLAQITHDQVCRVWI